MTLQHTVASLKLRERRGIALDEGILFRIIEAKGKEVAAALAKLRI